MSAVVYPVYMKKSPDGYIVRIPDLDLFTEGKDLSDAIEMARDEIGLAGTYYEDHHLSMPEPFSAKTAETDGDEFRTLIDIDLAVYRARNTCRLVKKNCTIPLYLERAAEKKGLNFSRVLTEALTERLFM